MLKFKSQNREANVCCQPQSHSHQKTFQVLLILFGASLLVGSTVSPAQAQMEFPPWAENDYGMTLYEVPILINILLNDSGFVAPIDPTTVSIVTQPSGGNVSIDATTGEVIYDPNPGFVGIDFFEYTVADEVGQVSNVANVQIDVLNFTPEIINFESYPGYDDAWTFEGAVTDENPGGLTVTFSGLLEGHSVTTNEDGTFSYTVVITESGIVGAKATDELGEVSVVEEVFVEYL